MRGKTDAHIYGRGLCLPRDRKNDIGAAECGASEHPPLLCVTGVKMMKKIMKLIGIIVAVAACAGAAAYIRERKDEKQAEKAKLPRPHGGIYQRYLKRPIDCFLATLALIVLSPVFLITAIAIKLSSPGPVFYFSERAGLHKKPFHFYKFRSMHVTDNDKHMCVADADRVFKVGKIIRRLKIDELPQLINVVKGDMSIVGPRPLMAESVDKFYAGRYASVLDVKPGLTSAASLFDYTVGDTYQDDVAYRQEVVPVKMEMELLYLEKQSFAYDASLIWRTVVTILSVMEGKKNFKEQPEYEAAVNALKEHAAAQPDETEDA